MYYKQKGEIAKHIDFILLDIVILEILYLILTKGVFFGIRRRIAFIIPLICIVMVITRIFYNNILRRKAIKEFIECIKYMIILNGGIMLYLYAMKISATFSRVLFVKFGVIADSLQFLVPEEAEIMLLPELSSDPFKDPEGFHSEMEFQKWFWGKLMEEGPTAAQYSSGALTTILSRFQSGYRLSVFDRHGPLSHHDISSLDDLLRETSGWSGEMAILY